jgi:hypothetical protein
MNKAYPQVVIDETNNWIKAGVFDEFIKEENVNVEFVKNEIANILFTKFISGDDVTDGMSEDEIIQVMNKSHASTVLEGLKSKGMIDSFELEDDDDEVYFLTEKGKKYNENNKT